METTEVCVGMDEGASLQRVDEVVGIAGTAAEVCSSVDEAEFSIRGLGGGVWAGATTACAPVVEGEVVAVCLEAMGVCLSLLRAESVASGVVVGKAVAAGLEAMGSNAREAESLTEDVGEVVGP